MLELRKMNLEDAKEQWEYVTALPTDENGLTNPYEGVSFEKYKTTILPELMMHEKPINMPEWFLPLEWLYLHRFHPTWHIPLDTCKGHSVRCEVLCRSPAQS